MDIAAELINKLKDRSISCQDIIQDFRERYKYIYIAEEAIRLERLFLCHATVYNRNDVVKCLQPLKPGGNMNPLVIAVKLNNLELIKLFVDAGYDTNSKEGDGFKAACDISAIELAIKEENVEAMLIMRCQHYDVFLLCYCITHNSISCFKNLLPKAFNYMEREELYILTNMCIAYFNLDILEYLVTELKSDAGFWESKYSQLVHKAAKLTYHMCYKEKAAKNLELIIHYLIIEEEIEVSTVDMTGANPLDYVLTGAYASILTDSIGQSITKICKLLLDAMKRETGLALPVPVYNVWQCVDVLCKLVGKGILSKYDEEFYMGLLKMFLDTGVNPLPRTFSGSLMHEVNNSLCVLTSNGSDASWRICENICILLFTYGEKPDCIYPCLQTAMSTSFTTTKYLVLQAISMMDSFVLNQVKKHAAGLVLGERKDEFDCIRWEKSLKEICRCALYNYIPNRRMAAHVDDLPLPNLVKQYLLFK